MEASAILLVVLSPDPPQENGSNTKYYFTWVVGRILCHLAILMKHLCWRETFDHKVKQCITRYPTPVVECVGMHKYWEVAYEGCTASRPS